MTNPFNMGWRADYSLWELALALSTQKVVPDGQLTVSSSCRALPLGASGIFAVEASLESNYPKPIESRGVRCRDEGVVDVVEEAPDIFYVIVRVARNSQ